MKKNSFFTLYSILGIIGIIGFISWKNQTFLLFSIFALIFPILFENWAITLFTKWMSLAKFLGKWQSKLLFGTIFIFVLVPIALLKKMKSNTFPSQNNNWEEVNEKEFDFEKLW
ncbi:MAG: hypothetical protein K1X82_10325 [Bacteroidia bacterium]|nr:hypothetical protein [Bacteroidia bacterium]